MELSYLLLTACVVMLWPSVHSFSSGPPSTACDSMIPGHFPNTPSTSEHSYEIDVSDTEFLRNQQISVTVRSATALFRGFMLQARSVISGERLGQFVNQSQASQPACGGMAITHTSSVAKLFVEVTWIAPADLVDRVQFRLTVVQSYDTFWTDILSAELESITTTTTQLPTTTTTQAPLPTTTTTQPPAPTTTTTQPPPQGNATTPSNRTTTTTMRVNGTVSTSRRPPVTVTLSPRPTTTTTRDIFPPVGSAGVPGISWLALAVTWLLCCVAMK